MWYEAQNAELQQWAVCEIQRVFRGYLGRLQWEAKYEEEWSRQIAAVRIQRMMRGWLARTRVMRMRRKIARAEFERARKRFKAAQLIQARVRGMVARVRVHAILTTQGQA